MRRNGILSQNVNFFVSVAFIAMFGIFMTTVTLKALSLEDPISNSIAATAAAVQ